MYGPAPSPVLRGVDGLIPAMVKCRILKKFLKVAAARRRGRSSVRPQLPRCCRCRSRPSRSAMPIGAPRALGKMKVLCNGRPCS